VTRSSARKLFAAALFTISLPLLGSADAGLRVKTAQGKIEGKLSSDGQVREFLGIPYAAPPIGPLRWKPPQPAAKWHGVRPATSFGNRCIQSSVFPDMIFRDAGQSEDCLTLNVWTPANAKGGKLPVMVWIYGGGFTAGATSEPRQDGEHLAHRGVLVVSMNYRLGIIGFFAHRELAAESPQHASGNYGLMDQTAALNWVQRNIAEFGGDPKNVTIFGESAGSFAVSAQMASPISQGLFAHAIGESGGAFSHTGLTFPSLTVSEKRDEEFAKNAFGNSSLRALRALSADELVKAATSKQPGIPRFGPNVDGFFLPDSVPSIYAEGKQAHVPLLAGWNKDEGAPQIVNAANIENVAAVELSGGDQIERGPPTQESLRELAKKDFGEQADAFLKAYSAGTDEEAVRVAKDYSGDRFIAFSTWAWLEAQVKTGNAPVYRYYFELGSPGDPHHPVSYGAFHSDDIEYVFGNLDFRKGAPWRPEDYKLSELLQSYWTNFAKTGNPNAPGLPNWPTYDAPGGWQVMHLSASPEAKPDQHRDRYLFLQEAWANSGSEDREVIK
jgi:para-nitrobenzyl esterase